MPALNETRIDLDALADMLRKGATRREAMDRFKVCRATVEHWAKRLGLTFNRDRKGRPVDFPRALFVQAARDGMTTRQAADRIGCHIHLVRRRAEELGLKFCRERPVPKPRAAFVPTTMADFARMENAALRRLGR